MKKAMKLAVLIGMGLLAVAMLGQTNGVDNSGVTANSNDAAKSNDATKANDAAKSNDAKSDKPTSGEAVQGTWNAPDYVIGPDDTLHISVWKEPELSETLPVRADGKISMPLLDDIPAAGSTPELLKELITARLKKFITDPRVTVVVTGMNSRRIFVSGEVAHTGPMPLLAHMTMLQALSQAGFTQFANLKKIYLLRTENGKQERIPFNYKEVIKGNHPEQNILLKPGDTLVVP
jgi:polysaccharide biosynthesis/export protein